MIPREHLLKLLVLAALLSITQSQNSRSYDTNDWIPITNKCATCYENDQKEPHVIEKKATGRVLNLAEADPTGTRFFPDEEPVKTKKSNRPNVQQFLREVSAPSKRLPKRQHELLQQQPLELRGIPADIQQQLNQGEFVNQQYYRQRPLQEPSPVRDYQSQPQQVPQQVQLTNQAILQQNPHLHQLLTPQGQPYIPGNSQFAPRPLFDIPLVPGGLNLYQTQYQNILPSSQAPANPVINKNAYAALNPGIQAINQGLAGDSNNNYKDLRQTTLTSTSPKPGAEKETVQLVYVPLESLNQRQQLQNQRTPLLETEQQQQEAVLQQVQFKAQEEQQLRARQEEYQRIQQEQQLKSRQELQLKAQREQQLKDRQEEALKAQRQLQQRAQEEAQLKAQQEHQAKVQQEEALRQQQLQQQQALQQPQLQVQNQPTLLLQQQLPQPVQFIQPTPKRRRPTRPQIKQHYQTRISSNQNDAPVEHKQQQLQSIQNDFAQQALSALKLQLQLQQDPSPEVLSQPITTTTPQTPTTLVTAKKRKPHQPPLAVYMESRGEVGVTDVLNVLKNAKSISVQDAVGPHSPQVFVGPHNLEPPEGYTKFELPYLSSIENNRVERKVDQLPFFVAPLSYRTPPGYSKIPLPAPHVGSVVISQPEQGNEKHTREQPPYRLENLLNEDPFRLGNQQAYLLEQQQRPVKPFRLENAINEAPFRLPTHPQQVLDPFSSPLVGPPPLEAVTSRPDLLGQTINQYELEQINNQFLPQQQPEHQPAQIQEPEQNEYEEAVTVRHHNRKNNRVVSTTPTVIPSRTQSVTETPREVQLTTRRTEGRSRRPTQRTAASTQSNVDKSRYTVLEEFTAKQRPTTANALDYSAESIDSSTPSSTSQLYSSNPQSRRQQVTERIPSSSQSTPLPLSFLTPQLLPQSVSQLVPQQQPEAQLELQQVTRQPTAQQSLQQVLNQDVLDGQILQQPIQQQNIPPGTSGVQTYFQLDANGRYVPVQNVDENAYRLVHQQQFEQEVEAFRSAEQTGPTTLAPPKEIVTTTVRLTTQRPTEQYTRTNARGGSRSRTRGRTQYIPESYEEETSEEKSKENENYKLPAQLPSIHPAIHSLINDLQDQAVRPLLAPASIAPTTEHASRGQSQRQREQYSSLSPVEQLEQELATQAPVQQQQRQQFASLSPVQQLEQELATQTPLRQRQQFASFPEVQGLEQELSSQPPLQQQRQQLISLSPVAQLEQQIVTEPSVEQQQQQQLVSQQVQQLEQQFRLQSPVQEVAPQFVSQSPRKPLEQYVLVPSTEGPLLSTTAEPPVTYSYKTTTAAPIETTTPNRRQRGRQRARVSTTTTSTRTTQRTARRPSSRTRSDSNRYQQELEDYVDYTPVKATESRSRESFRQQQVEYATEAPRRSPAKQRSRPRGRVQQEVQQLTERTLISNIAEEETFRQPQLQSGFQASSNPILQPQSYMQFEQPFELVQQPKIQVIDAERNQILNQYHPVYTAEPQPLTSTEQLPISTRPAPVEPQKLSVDVLITHPITESATREPVLTPKLVEDAPHVRFSSNVVSNARGQYRQDSEEITTRASQAKARGRGRGRTRTQTTPRPITTTVRQVKTTTEEHEEEFYGFIRPPNYNRPPATSQVRPKEPVVEPKLYSATYVSTTRKPLRVASNAATVHYEDQPPENSNAVPIYSKNAISTTPRVQFVGKLRPKFQPSTVRHPEPVEVATEEVTTERRYNTRTTKPTYSSKAKVRGRTRQTTRRPQAETTRPIAHKPTRTPPSEAKGHRFKPRGTSAYQLPDNLKHKSEDEDVAGGNYPAPFLKAQEVQTERPKFQITIDAGLEESQSEEDQLPYSSIYRPKIIRKDPSDVTNDQETPEINSYATHNDIPIDRKNVESLEQSSTPSVTSIIEESFNRQDKNDTDIIKGIMEEFMGDVDDSSEEVVSSSSVNPIEDLDSKEETASNFNGKSKSRRRGVWRLVKRPVDTFETAESQYVGSVVANSFDTVENKSPLKGQNNKFNSEDLNKKFYDTNIKQAESTTIKSDELVKASFEEVEVPSQQFESHSSTTESFFDSLYKMFGMEEEGQQNESLSSNENKSLHNKSSLNRVPPQFTEEKTNVGDDDPVDAPFVSAEAHGSDALSNVPLDARPNNLSVENEANQSEQAANQINLQNILQPPVLTTDTPDSSQPSLQISESLDPQLQPWDFGVKTSTSTEISHETEICYRGKCVKSSGTKIPAL